jgi:hypothetical protein
MPAVELGRYELEPDHRVHLPLERSDVDVLAGRGATAAGNQQNEGNNRSPEECPGYNGPIDELHVNPKRTMRTCSVLSQASSAE